MENRRIYFAKELRKYSEEIDLINELIYHPEKMLEMSDNEIDNVLNIIKKRKEFLNQSILELKQELSNTSKKEN